MMGEMELSILHLHLCLRSLTVCLSRSLVSSVMKTCDRELGYASDVL